ncbi:MAG: efflux RND transporter periplasmic adaptor subunit [Paludibacteraceae bacterium]|nr:efflux RND transporter periplasmic adaptor subunit [Paludibacteraceae bacterium]
MKKKAIIISVIVVVVAIVAFVVLRPKKKEITWTTHVIEPATVELSITATGYVQPVDQVEIGTQVSGEIEHIYVDYNSKVTKGQLIAELDKSTLNERLTQTLANEKSSEAALTLAQQTYNRTKELYEAKAATLKEFEQATSQLVQAQSSYENAKTNVREARVNLSYAEIYSPIDGIVLDRQVEEGQTVAASFSTPTMFIIAKDLKNMQVEADVDEADIGQVALGQRVTFTVDAYPTLSFEGTVGQIRLQPTVTNNVVTYTVIINAQNPDEKLFPGMTASVTIITQSETAPVVPLEAMNFQPTQEIFKSLDRPEMPKPGKEGFPPRPENMPAPGEMPNFPPEMGAMPPMMGAMPEMNGQMVWVKNGNSIHPRPVETGLSDGVNSIIVRGLQEGDTVVLSATTEVKEMKKRPGSNPFMPGPPPRR